MSEWSVSRAGTGHSAGTRTRTPWQVKGRKRNPWEGPHLFNRGIGWVTAWLHIIHLTFPQPSNNQRARQISKGRAEASDKYNSKRARVEKRVDKPIGSIHSPPVTLLPASPSLGHIYSHARHPGGRHPPKSVDEMQYSGLPGPARV